MNVRWGMLAVALCFSVLAQPHCGYAQAGDDADQQRLKQMRKELDELREKERTLKRQETELVKKLAELERQLRLKAEEKRALAEAERKKKAEQDKKKQYARVEARGKLVRLAFAPGSRMIESWIVITKDISWRLTIVSNKQVADLATKLANQEVIVSGLLEIERPDKLSYPVIRNTWDLSPFNPTFPGSIARMPPIVVESIRAAEEPK